MIGGGPDPAVERGKPDPTTDRGKPNPTADRGKPDPAVERGRPSPTADRGKPNPTVGRPESFGGADGHRSPAPAWTPRANAVADPCRMSSALSAHVSPAILAQPA